VVVCVEASTVEVIKSCKMVYPKLKWYKITFKSHTDICKSLYYIHTLCRVGECILNRRRMTRIWPHHVVNNIHIFIFMAASVNFLTYRSRNPHNSSDWDSRITRQLGYKHTLAVPWLRRLVAGLLSRRPGFDPWSVHVGFMVDKVALGQVFFSSTSVFPVSFIPPVLHYTEKRKKKLIIFITRLHNKPQGSGASVASAAGPFTTENTYTLCQNVSTKTKLLLLIISQQRNMLKCKSVEDRSSFFLSPLILCLTAMRTRCISLGGGGVKAACAYGLQPYHVHVPIVYKSGSLNLLVPLGPVQACNGIALRFLTLCVCGLRQIAVLWAILFLTLYMWIGCVGFVLPCIVSPWGGNM
jgi:hypothetical protein